MPTPTPTKKRKKRKEEDKRRKESNVRFVGEGDRTERVIVWIKGCTRGFGKYLPL